MNIVLPEPIAEELFDLDNQPSEMCLGYITEEIERHNFRAEDASVDGVLCCIRFSNSFVSGELIIDRYNQSFTISARTIADGGMYLPQTGNWKTVIGYLRILSREGD